MNDFDSLRPFRDEELPTALGHLLGNRKCLSLLLNFYLPPGLRRFSWAVRPLLQPALRLILSLQMSRVRSVYSLQSLLYPHVRRLVQKSSADFTVSGLKRLQKKPFLFVSNHRDITMDPILLAYALWMHGHKTMRIGFGDNLINESMPFVADLMRMNKGFIIRRSFADRREAVGHRRLLSSYIRHSISRDRESVWLAQSGGRAKDGDDRTHTTLPRMLALSGENDFADALRTLHIVPVSISYEYDPCDAGKARELQLAEQQGDYAKSGHEDMFSIAAGLIGWKGRIHMCFGEPLSGELRSPAHAAAEIDRQIHGNYVLFPSNYFACEMLDGTLPTGVWGPARQPFDAARLGAEREFFARRVEALPAELRPYVLQMYANALRNQQRLQDSSDLAAAAA